MAVLITEPLDNNPLTEDWQKLLFRTTLQGGGFMLLSLSNMSNTGIPQVLQGSRFEMNGSFYQVQANMSITGTPVNNVTNFIYAVSHAGGATFRWSTNTPVYNPLLGGWYHSGNRAVAQAFPTNASTFWNKVILDRETFVRRWNPQSLPTTGGTLVATGGVNNIITTLLPPGAYYLELRGGQGGNGGNGGDVFINVTFQFLGQPGSPGTVGTSVVRAFAIDTFCSVALFVGRAGENGGNGEGLSGNMATQSARGGGGGSGKNGAPSFISIETIGLIHALGGIGGRGGNGGSGGLIVPQGGASPAPDQFTHTSQAWATFPTNNGLRGENGTNPTPTLINPSGGLGATAFQNTSNGWARIFRTAQ